MFSSSLPLRFGGATYLVLGSELHVHGCCCLVRFWCCSSLVTSTSTSARSLFALAFSSPSPCAFSVLVFVLNLSLLSLASLSLADECEALNAPDLTRERSSPICHDITT